MAWYAIGDIQGCYQEFIGLLQKLDFSPSRDKLWLAGDLVNRGPDSLAVLNKIISLEGSAECVLGNHDLHLLATIYGARKPSNKDTMADILAADNLDQITDWLRQQPLFRHCPEYDISMVHAGVPPMWSIDQTLAYAAEVSDALQSTDCDAFLQQMYGNIPLIWDDSLVGNDRLRVITNYLTRMRFCSAIGELDLVDKASRFSSRDGFSAWFEFDNSLLTDSDQILFGHWAALEGVSGSPRHHALDTGCVWGGSLTAMDVHTKQRVHYEALKPALA